MPIYEYKARDNSGRPKLGIVDAKTRNSALILLKDQNLFVISLIERKVSIIDQFLSSSGVSQTEISVFTRQLSTMISSGLPISRALEVLTEQTSSRSAKRVLLDVLRDVEGGASLHVAFGRFPRAFSPTYQSLVKAGDTSGNLDEILKRLATTLEDERELRAKFIGALIYPAIVFTAMIGVFVLMMLFVIPKLADMYESMHVELPVITKFMIGISHFFVDRWYIIVLSFVGCFVGSKIMSQSIAGKEFLSRVYFALPVLGKISKQKELAEFTRTLSLLVTSAIPIVDALNIVADIAQSPDFKKAAYESAKYVQRGNSLSEYMHSNKVFPPILSQMVAVGEETGNLDVLLGRVSDFFTSETEHALKGLSAALEPIILILLGGMVGLLIVSIITPIYKITNSIA